MLKSSIAHRSLLIEFGFSMDALMSMPYDNQTAIFIVNNPIFMNTQSILRWIITVRDMVMRGVIFTLYT